VKVVSQLSKHPKREDYKAFVYDMGEDYQKKGYQARWYAAIDRHHSLPGKGNSRKAALADLMLNLREGNYPDEVLRFEVDPVTYDSKGNVIQSPEPDVPAAP
jgi:hypothetical protein